MQNHKMCQNITFTELVLHINDVIHNIVGRTLFELLFRSYRREEHHIIPTTVFIYSTLRATPRCWVKKAVQHNEKLI